MFKFIVLVVALAGAVWGAPQSELLETAPQYIELGDFEPADLEAPQARSEVPLLDGRIVGGSSTTIEAHPYIVSILRSGSHICGGAIISSTWIVSAAHCFSGSVSSFSIRAGSSTRNSGGQVVSASRILLHGSYNSATIDYDIALIQLVSAITVTNARAITLASDGTGPSAGTTTTITGWGSLTEGGSAATTLQVVQVPVVSQANCRSAYGTSSITDRMFCAGVLGTGGRDACQGDSGGPLVANGVLTGIVSWGAGCARPNYPGVYSNIPSLRSVPFEQVDPDGRIVGGNNATIQEYPYMVSIQSNGTHNCGGAIVTSTWILSAAHCLQGNRSLYSIRAGSTAPNSGGQVIAVNRTVIHENYKNGSFDYDIALIQLISPITHVNAIPIALARENSVPVAGTTATVTGWGALSEGGKMATTLQVVKIPIVSQANCQTAYRGMNITDRMFCAGSGGKDACQNDSGGPLVANGVLTGVVSFGASCGSPSYPGVYTSVPKLRAWIKTKTGTFTSSTNMFRFITLAAVFVCAVWSAPQSAELDESLKGFEDKFVELDEVQPEELGYIELGNSDVDVWEAPEAKAEVPMLDGRIVGGSSTTIATHPYIVSILRSGSHICGGTIISSTWIISAAHCFSGSVSAFSIRAGSSTRNSGGQVIAASRILLHANYNSRTIDYDIAAIQLVSAITVTNARAIGLASSAPAAGATATITGWGALTEGGAAATTLQVVQVPIVSQANCRSAYGTSAITDRMICAGLLGTGGRDACQGDSGGPLVTGSTLSGIVSWGSGCARPNFPGVYSNVANLRAWIRTNTGV
ncbi:hypothetical protein NQ315_011586 [Exocentrus adspersus]|uniref:Peptidase S1 domain-containing protein n=1 Tax=Exocentrus adspersus TaxID=1586481 RepID=A0AAV8VV75_9CUCU|nr:hypothetical protein NQ315_011586 [Exocentrus adspersus]